jgi:hypothetical protein
MSYHLPIIDDEPDIRELTAAFFTDQGTIFTVTLPGGNAPEATG